ncbi:MAG: hypothetical protein LBU80_07480 [Rikenellaceae bacterium]|jgi:hypothetical protein|nr:hypothetical protein [Rikenellaceae bacterium]
MDEIRPLQTAEVVAATAVIREAFTTVAETFGLTRENTPTHASFIEVDDLWALQDKGAVLFGGFSGGAGGIRRRATFTAGIGTLLC